MSIQFITANHNDIQSLQQQQVRTLTGALDVYWLQKTCRSSPYLIHSNNKLIGYLLVTKQKSLIEFFIIDDYVNLSETILKLLISQNYIITSYVSTRNPRLLSLCVDN